jgi:ribonuclease P protein component
VKLKSDKTAAKKITLGALKVRQEYLNVAASGVRGVARGLILQQGPITKSDKGGGVEEDEKGQISRIGITVTKKVGNAVERNFVKRRLRVLARTVLATNISQSADYVLVGRRAALKRTFDELSRDVLEAIKRLKYEKNGYKPKGKR